MTDDEYRQVQYANGEWSRTLEPVAVSPTTEPATTGFHDPMEYVDAGSPELCPCCGVEAREDQRTEAKWPICADDVPADPGEYAGGTRRWSHRESCAYYRYAPNVCVECDE